MQKGLLGGSYSQVPNCSLRDLGESAQVHCATGKKHNRLRQGLSKHQRVPVLGRLLGKGPRVTSSVDVVEQNSGREGSERDQEPRWKRLVKKGLHPWSGSSQQAGRRLCGAEAWTCTLMFATFSSLSASGVYILIGAGALMMLVGFLGCCGAVQESQCMLGLVSIPSVLAGASQSYLNPIPFPKCHQA